MTCEQSLRFFGRLSGLDRATLNKRIPDVLHEVGLHDQQAEVIERLSGGMRQRLGIAQAILHEPIFLILDEPASALDPSGRHDINQLILRLKKRMTIIVSTHLLEDAKTCCDRFLVIKHGKLLGPLDNQRNVDQYRIQVETLTAAPSFSATRFPRVEIDRINPCCYQFSAQQPLDLSQLAITLIQQDGRLLRLPINRSDSRNGSSTWWQTYEDLLYTDMDRVVGSMERMEIVWLPLFFIALGVTQPLLLMYMDVLLAHVGNADGIIVDPNRPAPQPLDVFSATIHGQFNQLGLIVLIMSFMGLLASDRQTGMQDFILTRPVSRNVYLLSKWFSHGMISLFGI